MPTVEQIQMKVDSLRPGGRKHGGVLRSSAHKLSLLDQLKDHLLGGEAGLRELV